MPMLFARLEPDHVSRPDLLDGAALALNPAQAERDDERLAQRMGVPSRARTGLERDMSPRNTRRIRRAEQRIDPDGAVEPFRRSLARGL